jgi:hypothetical protein
MQDIAPKNRSRRSLFPYSRYNLELVTAKMYAQIELLKLQRYNEYSHLPSLNWKLGTTTLPFKDLDAGAE